MIKNWKYHNLYLDYSSMYKGNNHPSDIDMIYLGKDRVLILGEIKNEMGELKRGQRKLLETLINGWQGDGLILFITHNRYWQNGDDVVNVAECEVKEVYFKSEGKWRPPSRKITVKEALDYYMEGT